MNPATFLRVLGPEPWRVAYVEPSVRPDDSRYGENPNRVQKHTQFQVGGYLGTLKTLKTGFSPFLGFFYRLCGNCAPFPRRETTLTDT